MMVYWSGRKGKKNERWSPPADGARLPGYTLCSHTVSPSLNDLVRLSLAFLRSVRSCIALMLSWVVEWTSLILATSWESVRELDASGVLKMMSVGVVGSRRWFYTERPTLFVF